MYRPRLSRSCGQMLWDCRERSQHSPGVMEHMSTPCMPSVVPPLARSRSWKETSCRLRGACPLRGRPPPSLSFRACVLFQRVQCPPTAASSCGFQSHSAGRHASPDTATQTRCMLCCQLYQALHSQAADPGPCAHTHVSLPPCLSHLCVPHPLPLCALPSLCVPSSLYGCLCLSCAFPPAASNPFPSLSR